MNEKRQAAIEERRADMENAVVLELIRWAINRDPALKADIALMLNDWKKLAVDANPQSFETDVEAEAARTLLGQLGLPGGEKDVTAIC